MGMKSNYFRHSFEAHNDIKIRKLINECGAKGYAVYFVLLEVYCAKLRDDDTQNLEQEIDLKVIGSYLKVRSDFVHRCIVVASKLQLCLIYDETMIKLQKSMIKLSIPNSLKYYGLYKKSGSENSPKERKVKEKKLKEINIYNKPTNEPLDKIPLADSVIKLWDEKMVPKGFPLAPLVMSSSMARKYVAASKRLEQENFDWSGYFDYILSSKILTGKLLPSLVQVMEDSWMDKIISGTYEEKQPINVDETLGKYGF